MALRRLWKPAARCVRSAGGMDDVTKAKLQLRLVLVTYRQQITRSPGDGHAAAVFRERAGHVLKSVELAHRGEPEVVQLLADVRRELDADTG